MLLALLTIAGSALNGITFSRGQPIAGLIVAMGLLHVGTLEVRNIPTLATVNVSVSICLHSVDGSVL